MFAEYTTWADTAWRYARCCGGKRPSGHGEAGMTWRRPLSEAETMSTSDHSGGHHEAGHHDVGHAHALHGRRRRRESNSLDTTLEHHLEDKHDTCFVPLAGAVPPEEIYGYSERCRRRSQESDSAGYSSDESLRALLFQTWEAKELFEEMREKARKRDERRLRRNTMCSQASIGSLGTVASEVSAVRRGSVQSMESAIAAEAAEFEEEWIKARERLRERQQLEVGADGKHHTGFSFAAIPDTRELEGVDAEKGAGRSKKQYIRNLKKKVEEYQANIYSRMERVGGDDPSRLRATLDPAAAVVDGVLGYYKHVESMGRQDTDDNDEDNRLRELKRIEQQIGKLQDAGVETRTSRNKY